MNTPPLQAFPCWRETIAVIVLPWCFLLTACADSVQQTSAPAGKPMARVKVLTYNTLHGLEPSGLTVKASESKDARQARLGLQFQQLAIIQPDVMLLQEVNALPEMAEAYVAALLELGLKYAEVSGMLRCPPRTWSGRGS